MNTIAESPGGHNYNRPKYVPINVQCSVTGLGKTKSYELLANGTFRAIKVGKRTLWDIEHNLAALAAMPSA